MLLPILFLKAGREGQHPGKIQIARDYPGRLQVKKSKFNKLGDQPQSPDSFLHSLLGIPPPTNC